MFYKRFLQQAVAFDHAVKVKKQPKRNWHEVIFYGIMVFVLFWMVYFVIRYYQHL